MIGLSFFSLICFFPWGGGVVDDRKTFQRLFTESMVNKTELTSYTRLQYKPASSSSHPSLALGNPAHANPRSGHAPLPSPYHPYSQQGQQSYHTQTPGHGHHMNPIQYGSPQPGDYQHQHHQQGYAPSPQRARQRENSGPAEGRKEVLFEIVGAPYFTPLEGTLKCFYAVAKPYPSRNTAM